MDSRRLQCRPILSLHADSESVVLCVDLFTSHHVADISSIAFQERRFLCRGDDTIDCGANAAEADL